MVLGSLNQATADRIHIRWETDSRFYEADIHRDLFGNEVLEITWGGKRNGIGQRRCIATGGAVAEALKRVLKERQRRQYKLLEA